MLADGYWAAKQGRDALAVQWDLGAQADLSAAKVPVSGVDAMAVEGLADHPYEIANQRIVYGRAEPGPQVWFWRSVGHSQNAFFIESFGSYVAEVAEVSVARDGTPKVHRVVAAVDCGQTVNPQTIARQIESAIVYGLSAALYGKITHKDERVEQSNFHDYPVLRIGEMPKVEVHIVPSMAAPGGIGEPGTPPIAPALMNAIFAATGVRVRKLPLETAALARA